MATNSSKTSLTRRYRRTKTYVESLDVVCPFCTKGILDTSFTCPSCKTTLAYDEGNFMHKWHGRNSAKVQH